MDRVLGAVSSVINICSVVIFAVCMQMNFLFVCYIASMFIAFSFVPMICALARYSSPDSKAISFTAIVFAGMYATVNLAVYFAQVTTVRLESLSRQADLLLNYQNFGLFFNFDLLGYCLMALSTFFIGLAVNKEAKAGKALRLLLLLHGAFAIACLIMPLTGIFNQDMKGSEWIGQAVLEVWCCYFTPVGILSFLYLKNQEAAEHAL